MSFFNYFIVITFATLLYAVEGTKVRKCSNFAGNLGDISITDCEGPPCKLRRKTSVDIVAKISPETDIKEMVNRVNIKLLNIPFPFIGVDGTSACANVLESDGVTKANCPLKKGQQYIYKNTIKVQEIYPTVKGVVHWALHDVGAGKDVTCFEILARII